MYVGRFSACRKGAGRVGHRLCRVPLDRPPTVSCHKPAPRDRLAAGDDDIHDRPYYE